MTDWPKNSRGIDCRALVLHFCSCEPKSPVLIARHIGRPVGSTIGLCERMAEHGWLSGAKSQRQAYKRWSTTPAGMAELATLTPDGAPDHKANTTRGRVTRALAELRQEHQDAWPDSAPERKVMRVPAAIVLERVNLRGPKRLTSETVQECGRFDMRTGRVSIGDGLVYAYARGEFSVWMNGTSEGSTP